MIERYTLPEMGAIWTDEARMQAWLDVEIAAVKAWHRLGKIPGDAVKEIEAKAAFDVARVNEIEQTTNHDVIAFLTNVAEYVGDASKYVHYGMTSSDMLDTALALQIKRAGQLLERDLIALGEVLKRRALEFRDTVEVGRTHGIHAEPITFGMKLGIWAFEISRHLKRMRVATIGASVGKISGAVGAYNNIDPRVEDLVCEELGIGREPISNQVVQRDRHAEFLTTIALVGASIEKFATEVRHLQRTEVREAEEAFGKGQKGSSAMPHKRNPILSERMAGCARVLRGNALVGMENVALWHERDISHSSAERVVLPDSTILLDYMLQKFTQAHGQPRRGRRAHAGEPGPELPPRLQRGGPAGPGRQGHAARGRLPRGAGRGHAGVARRRRLRRPHQGERRGHGRDDAAAEIDTAMDPDQYRAGRDVIFGRLERLEF